MNISFGKQFNFIFAAMNSGTKNTPIEYAVVREKIKESGLKSVGKASIREVKKLIDTIENKTGKKYIRMEMGIPGIPTLHAGVEAQIAALRKGVSSVYPNIQGVSLLKREFSKFLKLFMDIDLKPEGCLATVGSMQGGFAAFLTLSRMDKNKDTLLFVDPGFPVHKQQHKLLGLKYDSFDVYNFRGKALKDKLESYFKQGNIHSILYSNPNNPSWICFNDEELKIIGDLANKYDVVILEDLAYFGMDFRKDYSIPGQAPYQPTVAKYTENYILFVSSSKVFSYAGERVGMMAISNGLYKRKFPNLANSFPSEEFGYAMIFGAIYPLSAGVSHSAQYGLAGMFKALNNGDINFVDYVKTYGEKAKIMKKMFTDNGFEIVYDTDVDKPIADGFYFTFSYPGFDAEQLLDKLIYYGISAISLLITGSEKKEGIRACTSLVQIEQLPELKKRLVAFNMDYPI